MTRDRARLLGRHEEGAVAVMTAMLLVVLLLFSAFVIDLGALRADRAAAQSVSDMAATAAAQVYSPSADGAAHEACREAVAFANANVGASFSDTACDVFPTNEPCDPDTVIRASMEEEPYTLVIVSPVLESSNDDDGLMLGRDFAEVDGRPCDRIGVQLTRTRDFLLAQAGGAGTSGQVTAGAVGRAAPGDDEVYASLVVLERQGCESIAATGQGHIEVEAGVDPDTGEHLPGVITVDAVHDDCGSNKPVIYSNQSAAGGEIHAEDLIISYGLSQVGPTEQFRIYNAGHVPGKLSPRPDPGGQVTRSPVDHLVNCMTTYPDDKLWSPEHSNHVGWPIDGCDPAEGGESHIEPLHTALQDLAAPDNGLASAAQIDALHAAGWSVFPDDFEDDGKDCGSGASGTFGPSHETGEGSGEFFYLNCRGGGQALSPVGLHFDGVATVVSRNEVSMTAGSSELTVRGRDGGTVIYFQRGEIRRNSGVLDFQDSFVYMENGPVRLTGGGSVSWTAPGMGIDEASAACGLSTDDDDRSWPTATCYGPLTLWSNVKTTNTQSENRMGGGATLDLRGTFFTPNATFNMGGSTSYTLDRAQFFAAVLENSGQGTLTMVSNTDGIPVPVLGSGLIR